MIITIVIFVIITGCSIGYATEPPKEILILNSYSDRYSWSNDVMSGITDELNEKYPNAYIRVEYMDTKNIYNEAYIESFYNLIELKYKNVEIDAIVSADDNAFKFLLDYGDTLFKDVPIFFCGVNFIEKYEISELKDIYGVVEKSSANETLKVALNQNKELEKVYIVIEDTVSGRAAKEEIKLDLKDFKNIEVDFMDGKSLEEILNTLSELENDSIVIYAFYAVDKGNKVYTMSETTQMVVQASPVPVYGLWSFSMNHGIVGGQLVSGYQQGSAAANLLSDYFQGLKFEGKQRFKYSISKTHVYDYNVMTKFNLSLAKIPNNSVIINKPVTFYEKHKEVIWGSLLIITFLLIYNTQLRFQVKRKTKDLKNSLKRIEETQKKLIESEKMASLGGLVIGVAHEINTPLGNALTVASFIQKESQELKDKFTDGVLKRSDINKYTDLVDESSDILLKNLDNTANMVKAFKGIAIGHETDEESEFDLKSELGNLVLLYQSKVKDKNYSITLNCLEEIRLYGKPIKYYRIVENLISNSIEHGFENMDTGSIYINVFVEGEFLKINYCDTGKGIDKIKSKHVFEPFYTEKRGTGHPGLGLFTVYNIIKSLEGDIVLKTNINQGLCLEITIPVKK